MPGFSARPGPRSPKTCHICSFLPCTTATARPNVPAWGEPRDRPRPESKTPCSRKEFITQNLALVFQFLPAPFSSAEPETWHICSFPPCTTATARPHVPEWGEPRDRPRPQSKTPFLRKEFITPNLALIFQFLPAPSSSLHPMNGETNQKRPSHEKNLLKIWP